MRVEKLQVYQTPKMTWPRIVNETGDVVAECYTNDKVVLAMAAAPELLSALKKMTEAFGAADILATFVDGDKFWACGDAMAVLAKVKAGSSYGNLVKGPWKKEGSK